MIRTFGLSAAFSIGKGMINKATRIIKFCFMNISEILGLKIKSFIVLKKHPYEKEY
jgi:hypothetical protein